MLVFDTPLVRFHTALDKLDSLLASCLVFGYHLTPQGEG